MAMGYRNYTSYSIRGGNITVGHNLTSVCVPSHVFQPLPTTFAFPNFSKHISDHFLWKNSVPRASPFLKNASDPKLPVRYFKPF